MNSATPGKPAVTVFSAAPEPEPSSLWDVVRGTHRGRPIAGLSFSPTQRAPISYAGRRYTVEITGPPGGRRRFAIAAEGNQPEVPHEQLPHGEVNRGGRSGTLQIGDQRLTLSRRWQLRMPYPSTAWTWRHPAGGGRITVRRPNGTTLRVAELAIAGVPDADRLPQPTALLVLSALWLFLDHHNGRPADVGDVVSGL